MSRRLNALHNVEGDGSSKIESALNPRHLDKFVKERPVRRILPNLETEEDDVLMKCTAVSRISMSNERQLAEPSASLAQQTGVTATSGGLPSGQTTGRTYNSLRISIKPTYLIDLTVIVVECPKGMRRIYSRISLYDQRGEYVRQRVDHRPRKSTLDAEVTMQRERVTSERSTVNRSTTS